MTQLGVDQTQYYKFSSSIFDEILKGIKERQKLITPSWILYIVKILTSSLPSGPVLTTDHRSSVSKYERTVMDQAL